MRFFKNLFIGLRAYQKGLKFILDNKLYWYVIPPAILMLGIHQVGYLIQIHQPHYEVDNMNEMVWFLLRLLVEISIALLLMDTAKYLVVILFSPLLSHLSQKTEYILTGNAYQFSFKQLVHDVKRGLRIAMRNILWQYTFFLAIYLIAWLGWKEVDKSPLLNMIFFIGIYYYGFSFIDYVNERLLLNMDQSIQFARKNRGLTLAIGAVYSIMIASPLEIKALFDWSPFTANPFEFLYRFVLNLFLWACASFAPIWSIVSATIAMNDLLDLKKTREMLLENGIVNSAE